MALKHYERFPTVQNLSGGGKHGPFTRPRPGPGAKGGGVAPAGARAAPTRLWLSLRLRAWGWKLNGAFGGSPRPPRWSVLLLRPGLSKPSTDSTLSASYSKKRQRWLNIKKKGWESVTFSSFPLTRTGRSDPPNMTSVTKSGFTL